MSALTVSEPTTAEIAQAYSYHSLLVEPDCDSGDDYDYSDIDNNEELSGGDSGGSSDEGSEDESLKHKEPTIPLTRVRFQDHLTLPSFGQDFPYGRHRGCANTPLRDGLWLRDPNFRLMGSNMGFLSQLAQICIQAKVRDCNNPACLEKKKTMDLAAPKCGWPRFRDWALVSMSCQAAMSHEQKLSQAHTHLAKAASGCSIILKHCVMAKDQKARFIPFLDENPDRRVDLVGVSNIIYWMTKIQAEMGIGPKKFGIWGHRFLPSRVAVPAIESASLSVRELNICKHRLWNLVNVSDRKQSDLPDIIEIIKVHESFLNQKDHKDCTPGKCQGAHMNSELVGQLHKCGEEDSQERKDCQQLIFPVDLLETALELGKSTVWLCAGTRLSMPNDDYIAISHVWSDGTGVGAKDPGSVNKCLFEFFAGLAKRLDCKAVWWDALSIPQEPNARSKALNKMHWNYAHAKYTIVHDNYLLNFEWRDDGSPCLALVLSSWFTRGWTALELFMSNRVAVLFKNPKGGKPLIKDLDKDILAPGPAAVSRAHWLATSLIQRLRRPIDNIGDLLVILTPRSTSWIRDRTVIAGLLAGVPNCDFKRGESIIARDILKYLGKIPYTCLFHGKPTMYDFGGFSWCPAVLDEMPVDQSLDMKGGSGAKKAALLDIDENGSAEGYWWCRKLERLETNGKKVKPFENNVIAMVDINNALRHWKHCLLLRHSLDPNDPALLVVPFRVVRADPLLECRYVGAVIEDCKESTLKEEHDDFAWDEHWVRLGGDDSGTSKMRARKALELINRFYDVSSEAGAGNESDNENMSELSDYVQSSDEEVVDSAPASYDQAWYESETALDYDRQDAIDDAGPASRWGGLGPEHLFMAIKKQKKKAVQHLIKQKVELTIAQKKSLVEDLGKDEETTFDCIKMLGDVYVDNDMLHEAIKMYKIAVAGYESLAKLVEPLDYLEAQYVLSRVYVKVGQQRQAEKRPREAEDLFAKAKDLLDAVWRKCNEKTIRRQMKKANRSAQSKNTGGVGPQTTRGMANQPGRRAKGAKDSNTSSANNKFATQGNRDRLKDYNSGDHTDDWYRLELDTIADLTLLYADGHQFDQAAKTYCKALKKFGTPLDQIEVFIEEWESRLSQPHEENQVRDDAASHVYETALRRFDSLYRKTHVLNMITAVNLGINYSNRTKFLEAEELLRRALKGFEELIDSADGKTTGLKHMMTLLATRHLGVLLTLRHNFGEAQKLLEKARNGFSLKLGPEHPLTLTVLSDLAQNYYSKRPPQHDEAESLFRMAKIGFEKSIGSNHRLTLRTALGLSRVCAQKDVTTTLEICSDVLQRLAPRATAYDLDVCDTLFFLGRLYTEQGNLEHAETLLRECSAGFRFLGGPKSIKYLQASKRLGCLCSLRNKTEEAEKILSEALKGFETVQGAFHNSTLAIARDLGSLYLSQKRLKDAEALCDRAYKGFQKVYGRDSRSTAEAAQTLGSVYLEQGEFSNAKDMCTKAFHSFQNVLKDKNNHAILKAAMDTAKVCAAIGGMENTETAEKMYKRAVYGFTETKGADDPLTLDAQLKLGEVYRQQGRYRIAEEMILGALRKLKLKFPQGDATVFEAMLCLGNLRFDQGNTDNGDRQGDEYGKEAEHLIKEARDGLIKWLGPNAPLSLDASALLGELFLDGGCDADEGEELLKGVLEGYCETLTPGHPKTIRIMDRLIEQCEKETRPDEARALRKRKHEALEKGHGADNAVMIMDMTDRRYTKRDRYDMWGDYDRSELSTSSGGSDDEDMN